MKFLVSLCNKRPGRDKGPGVWLVECDTEVLKAVPIPLESLDFPRVDGIVGMARDRDGIVAMLQGPRMTGLLWLTVSYGVRAVRALQLTQNRHSLAVGDDRLYLVSTGTDAADIFTAVNRRR